MAEHVDHIEAVPDPVMRNLHAFWNERGLQSLCRSCHSRKTVTERNGKPHVLGCDADGNPVDPNHWAYR